MFAIIPRRVRCLPWAMLLGATVASGAPWGSTPDQNTVYDGWIRASQDKRAEEQRAKERARWFVLPTYKSELPELLAQGRVRREAEEEAAYYAAVNARREAAQRAWEEEQRARKEEERAILALYAAAESGDANAQMTIAESEEASAFGQWGIHRYEMIFGPRRSEALWRVVGLLRKHADEPERLTSFRPVESFLAELAAGGDVRAAREAGEFWAHRDDPFRAARFLSQAAGAGDMPAQQQALRLLAAEQVDWLPAEPGVVTGWARAAAQRGEINGQYLLGRSLCEGLEIKRDAAEGVAWLRRAVQNKKASGEASAAVRRKAAELAGLVLRDGIGVASDADAGIALLRVAADGGSGSAKLALGKTFLLGLGVPADRAQGLDWLRSAIDGGNGEAVFLVATACLQARSNDEEVIEGLTWLRRAAKRRPEAMLAYGKILFSGDFGVEPDAEEAMRYFGLAIQRYPKDPGVLDFVGDAYLQGIFGLPVKPEEGVKLLRQAAESGYVRSAQRLEAAYRDGVGVERDAVEATRWHARVTGG